LPHQCYWCFEGRGPADLIQHHWSRAANTSRLGQQSDRFCYLLPLLTRRCPSNGPNPSAVCSLLDSLTLRALPNLHPFRWMCSLKSGWTSSRARSWAHTPPLHRHLRPAAAVAVRRAPRGVRRAAPRPPHWSGSHFRSSSGFLHNALGSARATRACSARVIG
jgi:hypothetical protein